MDADRADALANNADKSAVAPVSPSSEGLTKQMLQDIVSDRGSGEMEHRHPLAVGFLPLIKFYVCRLYGPNQEADG